MPDRHAVEAHFPHCELDWRHHDPPFSDRLSRGLHYRITVSLGGVADPTSSYAFRQVFTRSKGAIRNRLARRAPSSKLGWQGDWGMAATAREKDLVPLLYQRLCPFQPERKPELIVESLNARQAVSTAADHIEEWTRQDLASRSLARELAEEPGGCIGNLLAGAGGEVAAARGADFVSAAEIRF